MGKSTQMLRDITEKISAGSGIFVVDPHGDLIDDLLSHIPAKRRNDVILFDPTQYHIGFNPLANVENPELVSDTILYAFKDIWRFAGMSTAVFDDVVEHTIRALLQVPNSTLLGMSYMLTSKQYREYVLSKGDNPYVAEYWRVFNDMSAKDQREETRSTRNKVNTFLLDSRMRRTFGQSKPSFTMSDILKDKIFLCRLPQGQLGSEKARLVGMLLLAQLHIACLGRTDRTPFHIFIDEVHLFQGHALMEMLSGVRKFGVSLSIAHQYLDQLDRELQSAVIGNIADRNIFKVSHADAEKLKEEAETKLDEREYFELYPGTAFHNGKLVDIEPVDEGSYSAEKTVAASKRQYASSTKAVDAEIDRFLRNV